MATDNRTDQLFPDVPEHYGDAILDMSGDVDFPVPQENYDTAYPAVDEAPYEDVVLPVVQMEPEIPAASSPVIAHDDDPTDELTAVLPVYGWSEADEHDTVVENPQADAADPGGEPAIGFPEVDADPYADAPDWVRAHIPRGPLVAEEQARRGLSARLPRRPARASVEHADVPDDVVAPAPKEPKEPKVKPARVSAAGGKKNPWVLVGAGAAALAVVAGTVVVLGSSDNTSDVAVPPLPSSARVAGPTVAAVEPAWCEGSTGGGKIVGRGPGDLASGPGLIQAFDYAYYVEHDGAKVASMMLTPNPVGTIQASIDAAAATGAAHCLTIAVTPNPNAFDVQLLLRTDSGSESTIPQRITVADSGAGLKIATLEEIR
ncbi:hypothetical protein [Rhodococcus koreensis]|uniref:DUF8176 domain-containing protein n=1 Tax=Rhodococcus koreensis TaxID=99653 RepID=A0A1H4I611_9NOCA|nr:hypothetical protein [Rhodococcus koreensis]SEB29216.1 hypothetical protein SAMN04490239_0046 [Rhodococcus koreensis]